MRLRLYEDVGEATDCELELAPVVEACGMVGVRVDDAGRPSGVRGREARFPVMELGVLVSLLGPDTGTLFGQSLG